MRPTVTDVVVSELKITSLCVFACLLVTSVIPAETFDATFYLLSVLQQLLILPV